MIWDRIESFIATMSSVIAAVCSILALVKIKKYSIDPEKIFRSIVLLVAIAAGALVLGILITSITTASTAIVAVCSIWVLIKINKYPIDQGSKVRKPTILSRVVLVMIAIGIISLFLNNLSAILGKIVKEECDIIASEAKTAILKGIRESNEKVVATLADSKEVCKVVYQEALERTRGGEFAYIDKAKGCYFVSENWKENGEPILLTLNEKKIIQDCFDSNKYKDEEDLCALIYLVLNDERMITELVRHRAYDVEYFKLNRIQDNNTIIDPNEVIIMFGPIPVVATKTLRHITPYEKIAIIGAYIDEKRQRYTTQ